jgi:hypothetical protein
MVKAQAVATYGGKPAAVDHKGRRLFLPLSIIARAAGMKVSCHSHHLCELIVSIE